MLVIAENFVRAPSGIRQRAANRWPIFINRAATLSVCRRRRSRAKRSRNASVTADVRFSPVSLCKLCGELMSFIILDVEMHGFDPDGRIIHNIYHL